MSQMNLARRSCTRLRGRLSVLAAAACLLTAGGAIADVPPGFQDTEIASGLAEPAALGFAPDGRLFFTEKATGRVRVIKDGGLLEAPFFDANDVIQPPAYFDSFLERGMLGIAFDPDFAATQWVYLYYSICKVPGSGMCQTAKNRVVRVTAGYQGSADRADPASQVILLDDIDNDAGSHNAGWLGFGPIDGKLYVSVGDGGLVHTKAQDPGSLDGKILRIDADGTVPLDNPFVGLFGARPEVWALGFRNPWRCRFDPDGRLFCGDVGEQTSEEIDVVVKGGNYGWPVTEGKFDSASMPQFEQPLYVYVHDLNDPDSVSTSRSITAGDFGSQTSFPEGYRQTFFFADYAQGWMRYIELAANGVSLASDTAGEFGTNLGGVTDLVASPDGALYYVDITHGTIHRISSTGSNHPPVAHATATPSQGDAPLTVQFSSAGTIDADGDPLTLSWDFGDGASSTDPAPSHSYTSLGAYTAVLTVSDGRVPTPGIATVSLPIIVGVPPVVTISTPQAGTLFVGGQTIDIAGNAADAQDGPLPSSALHWEIRFQHDTHYHPYVNDLVGSPQQFTTQTEGETSANVWYRVFLRATDSVGLTGETFVDVHPETAVMHFDTSPPGLGLTLDGQPIATPADVTGVVGVIRTIGAPSPQGANSFDSWSDGGVQIHTITTPSSDTTYTATYEGPTPTTTTSTSSTMAPPSTTTSTTGAPGTTSTTSNTVPEDTTTTSTTSTTGATTSTTAPGTTTSTTATSTTSSTDEGWSTTTTTSSSAEPTTTSTTPPGCSPAFTPEAVGCRIDQLASRVADVSAALGRSGPGLVRRVRRSSDRVARAAALCTSHRRSRARAALRSALRQLNTTATKLGSRSPRRIIPSGVAAQLQPLVAAAAADVKILRDGLSCP
jgi:glucose/arabinose dehydrogenase